MRKRKAWKIVVSLFMLPFLFLSMILAIDFQSNAEGEAFPEYEDGLYYDYVYSDGGELARSPKRTMDLMVKAGHPRTLFYIKDGEVHYVPMDGLNNLTVTKDGAAVSKSDYSISIFTGIGYVDGVFSFYFHKEGNYILTYKDTDAGVEESLPINVDLPDCALYSSQDPSIDSLISAAHKYYTKSDRICYIIANPSRITDEDSKYECEITNIKDNGNLTIEEIEKGIIYKATVNDGAAESFYADLTIKKTSYIRTAAGEWAVEGESSDSYSFNFCEQQKGFVIARPEVVDNEYVFNTNRNTYGNNLQVNSGINVPTTFCFGIRNGDYVDPVLTTDLVVAQDSAGNETDDCVITPIKDGIFEVIFKKVGSYSLQTNVDGQLSYAYIEVDLSPIALYSSEEVSDSTCLGNKAFYGDVNEFYINAVDYFKDNDIPGRESIIENVEVAPASAAKYVTAEKINDKQFKITVADNCNVSFSLKVFGKYRSYYIRGEEKEYGPYYSISPTFTFEKKVLVTPTARASQTANGVKVEWDASDDAVAYRVFRKAEGSTWKTVGDTTELFIEDKKGVAGTTYLYAVRCINADGTKYTSPLDTTKAVEIEYPIINLVSPKPTLTTSSGKVQITWTAVTGSPKYRIFRKTESGSWKKLTDVSTNSYTDSTGKAGENYTYAIRCLSADGTTLLSSLDKNKLATITYPAAGYVSPQPTAALAGNGISLSWNTVADSPNYRIFRKVDGGSWKKLKDVSTTTYTDTAVAEGKTYTYAIRCLAADGTTLLSSFDGNKVAEMTYQSAGPVSPKPEVSAVENGVSIAWTAQPGVAQYRVFKKTGTGSWKKLVDTADTSYVDTKVSAGKDYSYAVRCLDADGNLITKFDNNAVSTIVK